MQKLFFRKFFLSFGNLSNLFIEESWQCCTSWQQTLHGVSADNCMVAVESKDTTIGA